jgi:uncharacterized protein (TIGR02598 family)
MKISPPDAAPAMWNAKAFSLAEVVMALGIISIALVAILGVFPVGLTTSHSAQDTTRASEIAADILSSLASQAQTNSAGATITQPSPSGFSKVIPLTSNNTYTLGATNDGTLVDPYAAGLLYKVTVTTNANPAGFDSGYACQVSVRVAWQPFAQNYRDFVRVTSKY